MSALKIKDDQGNWINLPGLKGDKGDKGDKGESGVYLGTTAPSNEDINVWINPNGEAHTEAVVIDPTLTQEGQAADAKATGDKIGDLKTDFNSVCVDSDNVDFATANARKGMINISNQWSTAQISYKSYTFDVTSATYEMVVKAGANNAIIGLLKNSTLPHGNTPNFATGISGRTVVNAGETQTIKIPSDCTYITITKTTATTDNTPEIVVFHALKSIPAVDSTLQTPGAFADAKIVGDRFRELQDSLTETVFIDFSNETVYNYIISSSSNIWSGGGDRYCYIIPVSNLAKRLIISANAINNARYAFLKSNHPVAQTAPDYCDGVTAQTTVPSNTVATVDIPDDCNYIYVYKSYNGSDGAPTSASFYCVINAISEIESVKSQIDTIPIPATPSQIFNIDLANSEEYDICTNYDVANISENGYTPAEGWENRITINKYIVCDDVRYRANISLETAGFGVCVLGTESLAGSPADHATLVKFDFENSLVSFLTGSDDTDGGNIDGKTIPQYTYDSFTLENLSGTEYRIEIGRTKRVPYAKVYNLTTGTLCGEKTLSVYETSASYGGKAGAMYDLPNFGTLDGEITFKRISASVPNGVFAVFIGDSITEGSKLAWSDVWANKSIVYLGSGVNCGRGSGQIKHALLCASDILPAIAPKYVVVTIGTNGTPILAQYKNLIALIKRVNAIPIINHIPMNSKTGSGSTSEVNAVVKTLGVDSVRFDVATAIDNNISQGQNLSLFNADKLHPNASGGIALYNQFISDLGWIKSNA